MRKLELIPAHSVGTRGVAERAKSVESADTAAQFDHSESAQRESGRPDPARVDPRAELLLREHRIENMADVGRAFRPLHKAARRIWLDPIVAGGIHRACEISVRP